MNTSRFEEIIKEAGYETRHSSGRGTFGAECLAFDIESGQELGAAANIATTAETEAEQNEIVKAFKGARTDSMGRDGIVIYFPRYKYPESAAPVAEHDPDGDDAQDWAADEGERLGLTR